MACAGWNASPSTSPERLDQAKRADENRAAAKRTAEQQPGPVFPGHTSSVNPLTQAFGNNGFGAIPTIVEPEPTTNPSSPIEFGARTPLSQIKAFPNMGATSPAAMAQVYNSGGSALTARPPSQGDIMGMFANPQPDAPGFQGDGFNGAESFALPAVSLCCSSRARSGLIRQMWANMFGIKLDGKDGMGGLQ